MSENPNTPEVPETRASRKAASTTDAAPIPELAVAPERPRRSNWVLVLLFSLLALVGAVLLWRSFDTPPVQDLNSVGAAGYEGSWTDGEQELTFSADGSLKGTDGCNSVFGGWEFMDSRAQIGDLAMTEMACLDGNDEPIQGWVAQAAVAELKDSRLHFYSADGEELGTMKKGKADDRPQDAPEFLGSWKSGLQQIELTKDGRLSGTDGCNMVSSTWKQEADSISFSAMAGTRMACTDPETGDLVQGWILDASSATISADGLVIFDSSGNELGTMAR